MLVDSINKFLKNTLFYPHYLEFKSLKKDSAYAYEFLDGKVLETGAGDLFHKNNALKINNKINTYIATDYSSWDDLFEEANNNVSKFGFITKLIYGSTITKKDRLDKVCDATSLPFKNNEFDSYCSYEVLEHIKDVDSFFREAKRVVKGGVQL